MKTLIIVVVILVLLYLTYKKVSGNISFDYKFNSFDLSTLSLSDLISGNITTRFSLLLIITNNNNFSITLKNVTAKFFNADNNALIGESSDTENNKSDIVIAKNSINNIQEDFDIYINGNTIPFLLNIKNSVPVNIRYIIKANVFNFPVTIDKTIKWPQ